MSVSPARKIAFDILSKVEAGRGFAVELLQTAKVTALKETDRRLATEIALGALRWHGELDFQIERLAQRKIAKLDREVQIALRMGIYQIRFLDRVPKSAAVNDAVELVKLSRKRSAAGLVNAVLRKCALAPKLQAAISGGNPPPAAMEAARRTLPQWLLERWETNFGTQAANGLAWASVQVPPTTLRVRGGPEEAEMLKKELAKEGIAAHAGRYASHALVVERGRSQAMQAADESLSVIQDEASQIVADLVAPSPGQSVLDLCAAPGMKADAMAIAMGSGKIVACDVNSRRLREMKALFARGAASLAAMHFIQLDAATELPFSRKFDRILVDAPCSGTGTLARNPEIKLRLRPEDITRHAATQKRILANALRALAQGGRLVYATCSLEPEENDHVIESVLVESPGFSRLSGEELGKEFPRLAPLFDPNGSLMTRPDLQGMDGFFAAVVTSRIRNVLAE